MTGDCADFVAYVARGWRVWARSAAIMAGRRVISSLGHPLAGRPQGLGPEFWLNRTITPPRPLSGPPDQPVVAGRQVWLVSGSPTAVPVAGSHNRTVPLVVARSLSSGLNATSSTLPPGLAGRAAPVAGFHSWTVLSLSVVARSLPSGLNATPPATPLLPSAIAGRDAIGRPVAASHSRTVRSPPAVATSERLLLALASPSRMTRAERKSSGSDTRFRTTVFRSPRTCPPRGAALG